LNPSGGGAIILQYDDDLLFTTGACDIKKNK